MKQWICICVFLSSFGNLSAQNVYNYTVTFFAPNTNSGDCENRADQLGQRFSNQSGATIQSAVCFANNSNPSYLDASIEYSAPEAVAISKAFSIFRSSLDPNGEYASQNECLDDLERQEGMFIQATGLTPLISYCYSSSESSSYYFMEIEAIGSTDLRHTTVGTNVDGQIIGSDTDTLDLIKQRIEGLGYRTTDIALDSNGFWRRIHAGLYSVNRPQMLSNIEVRYESESSCQTDLAQSRERFLDSSPRIVALFCERLNTPQVSRINIVEFLDSLNDSSTFRHRVLPGIYQSRTACDADKARANAALTNARYDVIGLFCGITENRRIVMHSYFK